MARPVLLPEMDVGLLRTLIEKLEPMESGDPSATDEFEPLPPAMAAAQAAIDQAIRERQAGERRAAGGVLAGLAAESLGYSGSDRRLGDRRRGVGFGRRTRD